MQKKDDIKQLFKRYERGECTPEEEARLHNWLNHYAKHEASGLDELEATYQATVRSHNRSQLARWSSYAAAAVIPIRQQTTHTVFNFYAAAIFQL